MVTEIKRLYKNAIINDHPEPVGYKLSSSRESITDVHGQVADHDPPHEGYSVAEYSGSIIPRLPHRGYFPGHPESEIHRLIQEVYRCQFCTIPDDARIEHRFAELLAEWRKGIGGLSSPRAISSHPAYQQIIQMGEAILPMIFQELRDNGGWWYPALRALTAENPVPGEAKGRPPLNREAWLEWGRRNGYLQP